MLKRFKLWATFLANIVPYVGIDYIILNCLFACNRDGGGLVVLHKT